MVCARLSACFRGQGSILREDPQPPRRCAPVRQDLATARGFLLFTADDTLQPLRRRVSCLDQLAGNEARHKAVSLSVLRVVIHENVTSVLASFWKAVHGELLNSAKISCFFGF